VKPNSIVMLAFLFVLGSAASWTAAERKRDVREHPGEHALEIAGPRSFAFRRDSEAPRGMSGFRADADVVAGTRGYQLGDRCVVALYDDQVFLEVARNPVTGRVLVKHWSTPDLPRDYCGGEQALLLSATDWAAIRDAAVHQVTAASRIAAEEAARAKVRIAAAPAVAAEVRGLVPVAGQ
jgi:hypothetical protein